MRFIQFYTGARIFFYYRLNILVKTISLHQKIWIVKLPTQYFLLNALYENFSIVALRPFGINMIVISRVSFFQDHMPKDQSGWALRHIYLAIAYRNIKKVNRLYGNVFGMCILSSVYYICFYFDLLRTWNNMHIDTTHKPTNPQTHTYWLTDSSIFTYWLSRSSQLWNGLAQGSQYTNCLVSNAQILYSCAYTLESLLISVYSWRNKLF